MSKEKTRSERFKEELKALLAKYNAEIEIDKDPYDPFTKGTIEVYMDTVWDENNGAILEEYTVINLGRAVRP